MTAQKGFMTFIIGSDHTNGGATSGQRHACLIGDGIPEMHEPDDKMPGLALEYDLDPKGAQAVQLSVAKVSWLATLAGDTSGCGTFECMSEDWSKRHQIVRVVARPINEDGTVRQGGMMGGNYITSSDSRFPTTAPIPVHDRFE